MNTNIKYLTDEQGETISPVTSIKSVFDDNETPLLDIVYPVGSIYMSVNSTSPNSLFGGTWERIQGKFLLSANDTSEEYNVGKTGGNIKIKLTSDQLPAHTHTYAKPDTPTGSTKLTISQMPEHRHTLGSVYRYALDNSGNGGYALVTSGSSVATGTGNTSYTGSGSGHTHSISTTSTNSGSTGSGGYINIMPPFLSVYVWKRTA